MDSGEITKIYTAKEKNHQGEEKAYRMGEGFTNYISARGLISRMYKGLKSLNNKVTTQWINGPMEWTGHSLKKKKNKVMGNEYMKKNIPHL